MTKKEILASVGLTDSANDIQKFYEMFPNEADYDNYKNGGLIKKQEGGDVIRSTTDVAKRNDVLFRFLQMNQLDRDKLAKRSDVEIDNMEKYPQSVEGWMKYQDDVAEAKRRQYYEPIDRIKRTWFDEKQYQDGGSTQEQEIQQLLQQIAEQIGQGVEPEAIVQQLVESGVSQEQATMIVQKAMETSQQEQLPIAQNGMEYATQHNYLSNLDYGDFLNSVALGANSLTGYYSPIHALPNTGFLGKIKAAAGLASGLAGSYLGYAKLFAKDKSYLTDESKQMVGDKLQAALKTNSTITSPLQTNENKTTAENINSITNPYQNWVDKNNKNRPTYNGPLEAYIDDFTKAPLHKINPLPVTTNEKINNMTPPYMNEAPIESYWQTGGELPTAQNGLNWQPAGTQRTYPGYNMEQINQQLVPNYSPNYTPNYPYYEYGYGFLTDPFQYSSKRGSGLFESNISVNNLNHISGGIPDMTNYTKMPSNPNVNMMVNNPQIDNITGYIPRSQPSIFKSPYDLSSGSGIFNAQTAKNNLQVQLPSIGERVDNIDKLPLNTVDSETKYPFDSYTKRDDSFGSVSNSEDAESLAKYKQQVISRGDPLGFVTAMNAVAGLGIFNDVMSQTDIQKQYEEMLRRTGNTDNRFVAQNPNNPFGTYTPNAPMASNFMNVRNGYTQNIGTGTMSAKCGGTKKFKDGGVYTITEEEMKDLLAQGYDIEFLD